jgi:beta-galactosidase
MPNLHSEHPKRFDNTEEYACVYHEKMLKFFDRYTYLWATHVWNMFDFGSDGRNQGGDPGKNHKGLVTFDRKIKKDCFYAYKAWWTTDPFVHLCGTRFINRTGSTTLIKAYSNQKEVSFYLNDKLFKTVKADKVFTVKMPLTDGMKVEVRCGDMKESMVLHKVAERDPAYILPKGGNSYSWEKKKAGADVGAKAEQEKKN